MNAAKLEQVVEAGLTRVCFITFLPCIMLLTLPSQVFRKKRILKNCIAIWKMIPANQRCQDQMFHVTSFGIDQ